MYNIIEQTENQERKGHRIQNISSSKNGGGGRTVCIYAMGSGLQQRGRWGVGGGRLRLNLGWIVQTALQLTSDERSRGLEHGVPPLVYRMRRVVPPDPARDKLVNIATDFHVIYGLKQTGLYSPSSAHHPRIFVSRFSTKTVKEHCYVWFAQSRLYKKTGTRTRCSGFPGQWDFRASSMRAFSSRSSC